ncbi:MAG: AraC family transcriptional regulator [Dysgonamonadaceae bacterium]|jgi:AraC-like DNA-binding protein|nr:AraC family transcriptional regulator [Dysgonamonadaceae bacterium]
MERKHSFKKSCLADCINCQTDDSPVVEAFQGNRADSFSLKTKSIAVAFIAEGEADISFNSFAAKRAVKDDFLVIPAGADLRLHFSAKGCILCFYIHKDASFCKIFENLILNGKPSSRQDEFAVLKANPVIRNAVAILQKIMADGLRCRIFQTAVVEEIVFYICNFYSRGELELLFAPCKSDVGSYYLLYDSRLRKAIIGLQNRHFTVKSLAEAVNMDVQTFRFHFKRIFGMTPSRWILQERKSFIYSELTAGSLPLNELAAAAGFKSENYFYNYCRDNFDDTPQSIRKKSINTG